MTRILQKLLIDPSQRISESIKQIRIYLSSLASRRARPAEMLSLKLVANSSLVTESLSLMRMSLYLLWLSLKTLKNTKTLDRGVIHAAQLGKKSATSLTHIALFVVSQTAKSAWRRLGSSAYAQAIIEVRPWVSRLRVVMLVGERFADYATESSILKRWY